MPVGSVKPADKDEPDPPAPVETAGITMGGTLTVLLVSTQLGVVIVVVVEVDPLVGVTESEAVEAVPVPTEFVAVTVKV